MSAGRVESAEALSSDGDVGCLWAEERGMSAGRVESAEALSRDREGCRLAGGWFLLRRFRVTGNMSGGRVVFAEALSRDGDVGCCLAEFFHRTINYYHQLQKLPSSLFTTYIYHLRWRGKVPSLPYAAMLMLMSVEHATFVSDAR